MATFGRIALLALLASVAAPVAARQPSLEYDVKAAFVLNFTRFVEWPAASRRPPFAACVLAPDPFGGRLEATVAGEQWMGGGIEVRHVRDLHDAGACHLLYVPAGAAEKFADDASLLAGRPVLTIGEHPRFLEQGGMIHLFLEQNRVRFSVNQRAAESAGLQISSRLLRLARTVIPGMGGR
jgi:hypothetical protein